MASAMVDTAYPHSDEAMRLRRMLNEPLADALPMRLWCWGIDTDREDGRFSADAKQLAEIVRFRGDSEVLLRAFLDCDVIATTEMAGVYRIKGWRINARFFKERKRLRNLWKGQKTRARNAKVTREKRVGDARLTSDPYPSPIPSPSEDLQQHARATDDEQPLPTKREIRTTRGFPEAAFETDFREIGAKAGVTVAPFGDLERSITGKLLRRCGEAKLSQRAIITEWWRPCWTDLFGWSLQKLEQRFLEVAAAVHDPKARPKPKAAGFQRPRDDQPPTRARVPSADETAQRDARWKADLERDIAESPPTEETIQLARRGVGLEP